MKFVNPILNHHFANFTQKVLFLISLPQLETILKLFERGGWGWSHFVYNF
jgi:hypothetical protein